MFKIQTLNAISTTGLSQFPSGLYEITNDAPAPDAILLRSFNMHELQIPATVKAVGRAGAGTNNIPVAKLTEQGIPVFNTPGANANAVRELVIAGMLLASRNICQAWDYVSHLSADPSKLESEIEQNKKKFVGFELLGKTLGVIGLGSVGVKVANAAISLGMNVVGYDPTISVNRAWELSSNVKQAYSIEELLAQSDFVTLHVPLNDATKNLLNEQRIKTMKDGAVILNFARAGIIDERALLQALKEKKIRTYVTDFPSVEFKENPAVINLPHLGASTTEAEENCAIMIVKQIRNFLENGSIVNSVNFPVVELTKNNFGVRLAIVNANIPNMVAQISTRLGEVSVNINSLTNKSLHDIAYTVIDTDSDVTQGTLDSIKGIKGVVQIRKI